MQILRWLERLLWRWSSQGTKVPLPTQPPNPLCWWRQETDPPLAQGDYLRECLVPVIKPDFGGIATEEVQFDSADLVVITQSCDLANNKSEFAALCSIYRLDEFEEINPEFKKKGKWEEVRKGRVEALHLLASPIEPGNNRAALVVDFGQIFSLPVSYLRRHVAKQRDHWRLQSPFLEHFSQAIARFFMRVGLPSSILPYK